MPLGLTPNGLHAPLEPISLVKTKIVVHFARPGHTVQPQLRRRRAALAATAPKDHSCRTTALLAFTAPPHPRSLLVAPAPSALQAQHRALHSCSALISKIVAATT
jgi:hypothetical protein